METPPGHLSVLKREVVELLAVAERKILVDCTLGLGGHAEALLDAAGPDACLIGIDMDLENLRRAKDRLNRFTPRVRFFHANFSQLREVLAEAGLTGVDALVADLGVASTQLDDPRRGLSFLADGPLDMRLDATAGPTAADLVNSMPEGALADLIYAYGEDRLSRRIARAIVTARRAGRIERTAQLAQIVASAVPPGPPGRRSIHPATRTFQALRIAVNDELKSLEDLLSLLPGILSPGGRAAIISFHSLEDRRVKQAFAAWTAAGQAKLLTKKPLEPAADEVAVNPRSRSAKLRGVERIV